MKYNSGLASIYIILVAVVVLGLVGAVSQRSILKSFFVPGTTPVPVTSPIVTDVSSEVSQNPITPTTPAARSETPVETKTSDATVAAVETGRLASPLVVQDEKEFTLSSAVPVTFRWTPIVPKPQGPATYRLKVWQLMQGQSGTSAMRENKPIVEKEMMITESETTVSGIYTGPCKPPYLCEFAWRVEAVDMSVDASGEIKAETTTQ